MTFLNPLVLVGLIAAAIPLLVHLFNFRRPRRLDYSSLALLQALQRTTIQRMRIRQWLLLLLRTLALCAIIASFAQPVFKGSSGARFLGHANVSMAVVLDNSLSMLQRNADGTFFDQARQAVQDVADAAQPGDEVFGFSTAASAVFRRNDLAEIEVGNVTRTAAEAIWHAATHLAKEGAHLNRVVYYAGDFQESTLTDSTTYSLPGDVRIALVPVQAADRPNVAVIGAVIQSRIVELGQAVTIEATLVNHNVSPLENWAVSLYLEGERVAQTGLALAPNLPTRVTLLASPQSRGWLSGYVQTEDDTFLEDNRHYFTLHVPAVRDILVVRGAEANLQHLDLAFALRDGRGTLRTHTIDANALSATALARYDAVLLVEPSVLSTGEVTTLARYVERGGGLMLFPATEVDGANALLEVLEAGSVVFRETPMTVATADFEHPLFARVFEETLTGRIHQLERLEVYRMAMYTPGVGNESALMAHSDGTPFLQEIQYGAGRVLLMAVAPDLTWSDLPVRGLFVPLLYRAAFYLSAGESVQGDALVAGRLARLRVRSANRRLRLVTPSGVELVSDQEQVFGATLMDVQIDSQGIADVMAADSLVRRVSINLDERESRLVFAAPDSAAAALARVLSAPVEVPDSANLQSVADSITQARTGVSLWRHMLIAALVFLVAEMLVAMHWRPVD